MKTQTMLIVAAGAVGLFLLARASRQPTAAEVYAAQTAGINYGYAPVFTIQDLYRNSFSTR